MLLPKMWRIGIEKVWPSLYTEKQAGNLPFVNESSMESDGKHEN